MEAEQAQQQPDQNPVAIAGIEGRSGGAGQYDIDYAANANRLVIGDPAVRVDHRGDAGVGRADHRQTLLNRPEARVLQMLARSGAVAEPRIIGDIQEPSWPGAAVDDGADEHGAGADPGVPPRASGRLA